VHYADICDSLRAMSGPAQPNVLTEAADALERMRWRPWDSEKPPSPSRILVNRRVNGQSYVDVIAYLYEEPCGLPSLFDTKHVVAWMPLPEPPA
jgi:hypothetical protein